MTDTAFAACPICVIPTAAERSFVVEARMEVRRCLWCNGNVEVRPRQGVGRDPIEVALEELLKRHL